MLFKKSITKKKTNSKLVFFIVLKHENHYFCGFFDIFLYGYRQEIIKKVQNCVFYGSKMVKFWLNWECLLRFLCNLALFSNHIVCAFLTETIEFFLWKSWDFFDCVAFQFFKEFWFFKRKGGFVVHNNVVNNFNVV